MTAEQSLSELRGILERHKQNQTIYKDKLRQINSTRNQIADQLDALQHSYEQKIKSHQLKLETLKNHNETLIRQNILYKTQIESYQSRLLEKEKIIAMLLNQKKDNGGVGSSDRSKSEKTDSINANANEQDYKSFKKQTTQILKQESEPSHYNDRIKEQSSWQQKPAIESAHQKQDKTVEASQQTAHIVKNIASTAIKRKHPPLKQSKNQDIAEQSSVENTQSPSSNVETVLIQKQQQRQARSVPPPPPPKQKRTAPPPPHKKGEHKSTVPVIPEVIKQISSLNNSNTYAQQQINQSALAQFQQNQPVEQFQKLEQLNVNNEQLPEKQQQAQIEEYYNFHQNYQPSLQQDIAQTAYVQTNTRQQEVATVQPQQENSQLQAYQSKPDQTNTNNFWSSFTNNEEEEEHQQPVYTSHIAKKAKPAQKKKTAARSNILEINFQSERSMNSNDFFNQLGKAESQSNHLQIEESSIDHIDRDNSLISNEHAYFSQQPIINTKPRGVKMPKKKGKRDQIKIVDPSLFE